MAPNLKGRGYQQEGSACAIIGYSVSTHRALLDRKTSTEELREKHPKVLRICPHRFSLDVFEENKKHYQSQRMVKMVMVPSWSRQLMYNEERRVVKEAGGVFIKGTAS